MIIMKSGCFLRLCSVTSLSALAFLSIISEVHQDKIVGS